MLNWTQIKAENSPWIQVSINHLHNDNYEKIVLKLKNCFKIVLTIVNN